MILTWAEHYPDIHDIQPNRSSNPNWQELDKKNSMRQENKPATSQKLCFDSTKMISNVITKEILSFFDLNIAIWLI